MKDIWRQIPVLESTRVLLRPVWDTDLDAIFEIFSDPQVMRYWSTPPLRDVAAAAELITEIHQNFADQRFLKWGVALRDNDQLVGTTTLFNLDLANRRAEIGYALGRAHWGRGYMNESLQRMLRFAFDDLELHRLEADVDPRNTGSIKTLERLGFQREGYLRERWQVNGEIQDALFYGLLKNEWRR